MCIRDSSLAMQPSKLSEFITLVRDRFEQAAREGEAPVLVLSLIHISEPTRPY